MKKYSIEIIVEAESEDDAMSKLDGVDFMECAIEETYDSKEYRRCMMRTNLLEKIAVTETGRLIANFMRKYNTELQKERIKNKNYKMLSEMYNDIAYITDYMNENKQEIPEGCKLFYGSSSFEMDYECDGLNVWYLSEATMEDSIKSSERY